MPGKCKLLEFIYSCSVILCVAVNSAASVCVVITESFTKCLSEGNRLQYPSMANGRGCSVRHSPVLIDSP